MNFTKGTAKRQILLLLLIVIVLGFVVMDALHYASLQAFIAEMNENNLLLLTPLLLPAVMLPGGGSLFKSKISLVILATVAVTSGILLMRNAGGWFGQGPVEPYMWHKTGHIRVEGREIPVVYLNIQNKGSGAMKLRLEPVMSPGETSFVLTSQQYNETKKQWVDYPIGRLLSERSKSMFPLEIRPGGSFLVEMIFIPANNADPPGLQMFENRPGRYSVAISDPVKFRTYRHEIDVLPLPPAPA